jgi:SAM-dependent methyltransferase
MDRVARHFNYRVLPASLLDMYQIDNGDSCSEAESPTLVSLNASTYLQRDNPRLLELRRLSAELDETLKKPLIWTEEYAAGMELTHFRGHSNWVWQLGHQSLHKSAYLLAAYYILANDRLGLMRKFTEDGAFGAITYKVAGRRLSRDLLDSILEIDFLDRHIKIASHPGLSVLDIGAGYGRLAHRMLSALPSVTNYLCADVVPESSFVCEFYLRFRGLEGRFKIVPAKDIDQELESATVSLAVNIHSFSECTLNAVQWWLDRLAAHQVKYFMIVPNACGHGGEVLRNHAGEDMLPLIERSNYQLLVREPKYADPELQKFALNPTWYWLFERNDGM